MSDPRPTEARLREALTDDVLATAHRVWAYPNMRDVIIAAILPVVEEPQPYITALKLENMECAKQPAEAQTPAPTCATCQHSLLQAWKQYRGTYCQALAVHIDADPGVFGCTLHEAVRSDAVESRRPDEPPDGESYPEEG